MGKTYGWERLAVGAHYGTRDFIAQRSTAALIVLFTLVLAVLVLLPGELDYARWAGIFAAQPMKLLTFAAIVSVAWHAWVGIRDIWMDYIKPVWLRIVLQVFSIAWLIACAGWAVQVLWRL